MYVYVCVCMYIYIYRYIYTCTCIYSEVLVACFTSGFASVYLEKLLKQTHT